MWSCVNISAVVEVHFVKSGRNFSGEIIIVHGQPKS